MIQENNKDSIENKLFFNRRRIILLSIFFVITVALIAITLTDILKIDFSNLISMFGYSINKNGIACFLYFLFILLLFPFVKLFTYVFYFHITLKKLGLRIRKRDWFIASWVSFLIICISPSSLGSEPFWIYWINKKIFNMKKASAIVLVNSVLMQLSSIIVTTPSFIYFCTQYENIVSNENGLIVFWFSVIGISIDFIILIGLYVIIFSKRIHYFFSSIFHWVKKILGLNYKTKKEIISETITDMYFKKEAISILRLYSCSITGLISYIIFTIFLYGCLYLSFGMIADLETISFSAIFNYSNVGVTANNFVPLPGSEGSLQIILKIMLSTSLGSTDTMKESIDNSIFIWRFFTNWFPASVGLIIISVKLINKFINFKNKKINNNRELKSGVLFIYDENSFLMNGKVLERYSNLFKGNLDKKDVYVLDYKKILKMLNNDSLRNRRNAILEHIKKHSNIYASVREYLKFLYWKNKLLKINSKIIKQYLLIKNFNSIIDFSFFGFKILASHNEYYWVQNKAYNEINGYIFKSNIKNFFSYKLKKMILCFDPFYCIDNVVVVKEEDKSIGNNYKFIYINSLTPNQERKYFSKLNNKQ